MSPVSEVACPHCGETMPAHTYDVHEVLRHPEQRRRPVPAQLVDLALVLAPVMTLWLIAAAVLR